MSAAYAKTLWTRFCALTVISTQTTLRAEGAMDLAPELLRIKQCCFVSSPPFERQQKGLGT